MTGYFTDYWRVREQMCRTMARSCPSERARSDWISLADGCAKHAEAIEHVALQAARFVSMQPTPASNDP